MMNTILKHSILPLYTKFREVEHEGFDIDSKRYEKVFFFSPTFGPFNPPVELENKLYLFRL